LQQEILPLLQTAGFTLRKWASNHSTFLDNIPEELQETQQTLSLDNGGVTTLGLQWNPRNDQLQVKNNIAQVHPKDSTASTKRKVLATTASIFDPLGLLSPAVIAYKIFLQKLWQNKLQGDEQLPAHLKKEWDQLLYTIPKRSQIKATETLYVQMLPTSKYVDFVTALNELMEPVYTFAPQTATMKHFVNSCVQHQRLLL
jgi:hypothetical protein